MGNVWCCVTKLNNSCEGSNSKCGTNALYAMPKKLLLHAMHSYVLRYASSMPDCVWVVFEVEISLQ